MHLRMGNWDSDALYTCVYNDPTDKLVNLWPILQQQKTQGPNMPVVKSFPSGGKTQISGLSGEPGFLVPFFFRNSNFRPDDGGFRIQVHPRNLTP